jgi:hypothetical protein
MHEHLEEWEGAEGNAWLFEGQRGGAPQPLGDTVPSAALCLRRAAGGGDTSHPRHTFGKNLVDARVPLDRAASLLSH